MSKSVKVLAKHSKNLVQRGKYIAAGMGTALVSAVVTAEPVVLDLADATAQIDAGKGSVTTVFGALFALGALILVGRITWGLLRR